MFTFLRFVFAKFRRRPFHWPEPELPAPVALLRLRFVRIAEQRLEEILEVPER